MKKHVVYIFLIFFVLLDGYILLELFWEKQEMTRLEKTNLELIISNENHEKNRADLNFVMRRNREAACRPILLNDRITSFLHSQPKDSYLLARYDVEMCTTCLEKFFIWLEDLINKVGTENVILFQIGQSVLLNPEALLPEGVRIIPIRADELYAEDYLHTETPYVFVYQKGCDLPLLISLYPSFISGLDNIYSQAFVSYVRRNAQKNDVEECDPALYIHNAVGTWDYYTLEEDMEKGDTLLLPTGKQTILRSDFCKGTQIRYANYQVSEGDCCARAHLEQEYRFP